MLFQLAVTLWRPLAVPGTPDQRGAFPCSQIPSRSWQCHVRLHHSVSEYKILPVWLHPAWLPGNSLWSVHWELSNPGYPAPAPLNHLGATLCASAAWWKEESKACWPNHMQTTHQRSATRHGGTDSCQSHRQPPEHISASRGQNHHCPGRPAQHHNICRGLLSRQHQECTFKRGNWGRGLHSDPGRVLVQSGCLGKFIIFCNISEHCDSIQSPEQKLLKTSTNICFFAVWFFAFCFTFYLILIFYFLSYLYVPCVYFTYLFNKCLSMYKIRVVSQTLLFYLSLTKSQCGIFMIPLFKG